MRPSYVQTTHHEGKVGDGYCSGENLGCSQAVVALDALCRTFSSKRGVDTLVVSNQIHVFSVTRWSEFSLGRGSREMFRAYFRALLVQVSYLACTLHVNCIYRRGWQTLTERCTREVRQRVHALAQNTPKLRASYVVGGRDRSGS